MLSLKKIFRIALLAARSFPLSQLGKNRSAHRELVHLISPKKEIDYETSRVEARLELSRKAQQKTSRSL